jgi:hypothetical protein
VPAFLADWLARPAPEEADLALQILAVLARDAAADRLIAAALRLEVPALRKFLRALPWCAGFPYGREAQLAAALARHADAEVREWAATRLPAAKPKTAVKQPPPSGKVATLPKPLAKKFADCAESALEKTVAPCLAAPTLGLCAALAGRRTPARPNLPVCLAVLGSHDPVDEVAGQFRRFGSEESAFLKRLDVEMVKTWRGKKHLPLLGNAWLYRWDEHCLAFGEQLTAWPGGMVDGLRFGLTLGSPVLCRQMWEALNFLLGIWRWRDRPRLETSCTEELGALLIEQLPEAQGDLAAAILVRMHEAAVHPERTEAWRALVRPLLPDLGDEVRNTLADWISSKGLPASGPRRRAAEFVAPQVLERIRDSTDGDELGARCRDPRPVVAEEAALRLLELGEAGRIQLAGLLRETPPPPSAATLGSTVTLWAEGPALQAVRDIISDEAGSPEVRFVIGAALVKRGERAFLSALFDLACQESVPPWFGSEHWQRLLKLGVPEREAAVRLAVSPQPHAYLPALAYLTAQTDLDEAGRRALAAFLECGTERLQDQRIRAALWLHRHGVHDGFPLLLPYAADKSGEVTDLFHVPRELIETAVTAVLTAGNRHFQERVLLSLLESEGVEPRAQHEAFERLLTEAVTLSVRANVVALVGRGPSKARKLRRVGETFAWGVRTARALTGRMFTVEMIAGQDLGYTRFEENKLYITPLPILRGDRHGRDVVEGLLLHEVGHHIYHRGPDKQSVWDAAARQQLHPLLNLVADEHLERNLRARDESYGDRLKKLAAFAFQHAAREIPVEQLLDALQGQAFAVLSAVRLGAARQPGCVTVEGGRALLEMEKAGLSFARFVRALRMGLGNRHHDPKVTAGLALFRRGFRDSSMDALLDIARRLREIFGWQTQILNAFCQDELLRVGEGDLLSQGEGISNDELQSEIRRVLNPGKRRPRDDAGAEGGRWINVSPDEHFNHITTVVPVPFDRAEHAPYARRVARHARRMRSYLEELGLALEPERFRLRGRTLDRPRTKALVLRGDPRVLIARELRIKTDLFLGVLIDCSGSMQTHENIEKAKLFAALLAEAARGLRGIDLRLFGFTDKVIYDAGTASRCAAHALKAGGGNNDAAALWHAAQVARASRRKARLLVMISDGLPTECSAAALKALVARLGRRLGICCAQVAVQPLAEICFPHYVLLEENDLDAGVRRFGAVVARLVRTALKPS